MNYEQMSDFEINGAVGVCRFGSPGNEDYCRNPSDAWPVIVENSIGIEPSVINGEWVATFIENPVSDNLASGICHVDANPLRAAMIVFLMMREDKSGAIDA